MFNWKIEAVLVKPQEGDRTDVVATVHWRCSANQDTQWGVCYGNMSFVAGDTFIPYQDITQEQMLEWCFANGVDKAGVEAIVTKSLANKVVGSIEMKLPPWRES